MTKHLSILPPLALILATSLIMWRGDYPEDSKVREDIFDSVPGVEVYNSNKGTLRNFYEVENIPHNNSAWEISAYDTTRIYIEVPDLDKDGFPNPNLF